MKNNKLKFFLDDRYQFYNKKKFIATDPIQIPHRFTKLQDVEITGFWAAMLAWGNRTTIINKCNELLNLMDNDPYNFVVNAEEKDYKRFENFKHRTFNFTDTLHFLNFFKKYYTENKSLETAFTIGVNDSSENLAQGLINFHQLFFNIKDAPQRTRKHVASPTKKSTCKRLNMFLRWMVRRDESGVDFGLWKSIKPQLLLCPLDVHVERVARKLNLITRKQCDWQTTVELTQALKQFDANDPVKYDFALFGLGVEEKF